MTEPGYYWGEVSQDDARAFLELAEREGWREAASRRFSGDEGLLRYVLDPQRTPWVSLLGLGEDAVALDIGSGYGAITHALAAQVSEVYSLEAIPERVEFTRIRLAQEGIDNVRLVQGSALELPMLDGFFDLVVLNGVLEWVGEWTTEGDPRQVQLEVLRKIFRTLKPNGTLVIGIENRISLDAFRGSRDHSGVPYTSLMPRGLASLYLRLDRRPHHRTVLNARRQYRTYTYAERGYRNLLSESGFESTAFYWPDPGYNEPYTLVPLREPYVRHHMRSILDDPDGAGRPSASNWRRRIKRAWTALGMVRPFVSAFVIVAQKREGEGDGHAHGERLVRALQASLPALAGVEHPICELSTRPFYRRNIVKVFEAGASTPSLIVKSSTPTDGSREALAAEYRTLTLVHERIGAQAWPPFAVPRPLGASTHGALDYTVESRAEGQELWRLLAANVREGRLDQVRSELRRCVEASIELTRMLWGEATVQRVDDKWWELPSDLAGQMDRFLRDALAVPISERQYPDCVQHGDYTAANIFVEPRAGRLTLIDWEHTLRGLPPLYDCFALLLSVLPVVAAREGSARNGGDAAQVLDVFFEGGRWADATREMLLLACSRLSISHEQIWPMFLQSLVLRRQYYVHRWSPHARVYDDLLIAAWQHRDEFVFSHGPQP